MTTPAPRSMSDIVDATDVMICCGTGGVGKTTTAAALAMTAAQRGRRVVVVTIDPARRLADALGLEGIDNDCVRVDTPGEGQLWVTMLDTKAMFDSLIDTHAHSAEQAERILTNRYYRNLSTSLSGTREFMATERLYELHNDERFDLVVVDTPPSRSALDFLEAPDKLGRFLDGRMFRLAAPGRRITRKLTTPLLLFLRRIARVISPEVVDDTLAFIEAFSGMEDGFKKRAEAVDKLLANEGTAFVVVTAPRAEAVHESCYFADQLEVASIAVRAIVVNRLQPRFTQRQLDELDLASASEPLTAQMAVLREFAAVADAEEQEIGVLLAKCDSAVVGRVRQLDHDVHSLEGIGEVAKQLLA